MSLPDASHPIVFFDGPCGLCQRVVRFVLRHERDHELLFASLQSPAAGRLLGPLGVTIDASAPDTVWLLESGRPFSQSTAALRISAHLRWPWKALAWLVIVPPIFRDAAYRFVARRRHRWFGREEACILATPATAHRFLDT